MARGALDGKISTTCIGFGSYFNEDLLAAMADSGGANYWYIESIDQMGPVFDEEIDGLVSLVAQNATVRVRLTHPSVNGVTLMQELPIERPSDGSFVVTLGDVYGTSVRELGLVFHVDDLATLGSTSLGEVEIKADLVTEQGIEHPELLASGTERSRHLDALEGKRFSHAAKDNADPKAARPSRARRHT